MDSAKTPMQPLVMDPHGVIRFKSNKVVELLLEKSRYLGFGLNQLATMNFPQEDWEQFYQLIGYSVSGYGDLPQVSKASVRKADMRADKLRSKEQT